MRTTVLPSMLDCLAHNHAHRNPAASLFELGTVYTPAVKDGRADPDVLPHEEKILTLGSYGRLSFFQFKTELIVFTGTQSSASNHIT